MDALFLDFDGTLVELAEHPESVSVQAHLPTLLGAVSGALRGALALVSGRSLATLDRRLAPFRSAAAGLHGLEWRHAADGEIERADAVDLAAVAEAARRAASSLPPGAWVEDKGASIAIHFRAAPHAIAACGEIATAIAQRLGLQVLSGKMVFELRPPGFDKGHALERLMSLPPFAGAKPMFVGDDVTDEDGFAAARAFGGVGVKVGHGATTAEHRLDRVADVEDWLERIARGGG